MDTPSSFFPASDNHNFCICWSLRRLWCSYSYLPTCCGAQLRHQDPRLCSRSTNSMQPYVKLYGLQTAVQHAVPSCSIEASYAATGHSLSEHYATLIPLASIGQAVGNAGYLDSICRLNARRSYGPLATWRIVQVLGEPLVGCCLPLSSAACGYLRVPTCWLRGHTG